MQTVLFNVVLPEFELNQSNMDAVGFQVLTNFLLELQRHENEDVQSINLV